jgi:hypothetical protein
MVQPPGDADGRRGLRWRVLAWSVAATLLALPVLTGAPWTLSDYAFAAVLLGSIGLALELVLRRSVSGPYRLGAAVALATGGLTVWVTAAVGMIGSEQDPWNRAFRAVLLVAVAGAVLARFRPSGLSRAMGATAVAHVAVCLAGLPSDPRGAVLSLAFAGPWLWAALLFRNAARSRPR